MVMKTTKRTNPLDKSRRSGFAKDVSGWVDRRVEKHGVSVNIWKKLMVCGWFAEMTDASTKHNLTNS